MENITTIKEIVIILVVSLPIIFLFKKINIPGIVGFLIAGMIIGPFGFRLISNTEQINTIAEIGVILLLFTIGLEVSLKKLLGMKKLLIYAGGIQVFVTIIISAAILASQDIAINKAIFYGMLISLSSTAIVLKLLSDRKELEAPHGRISLGILIFQDLLVVPLFIFLPILGHGEQFDFLGIILKVSYAFGAVALIIIAARFLMPKILFQLANLRTREAFTIGIILLLLGTAYLTHLLGLSLALGAFIAGLILSESEFSWEITGLVLPFKDVFNSIFFVSIGMLLNVNFLIDNLSLLLIVTAALILMKSLVIISEVKLMRYPLRTAVLTGLGLAQIGEFSFILAQAGMGFNLISTDFFDAFISSSIFSMMITPFLFQLTPIIANKLGKIEPTSKKISPELTNELKNHVIIVGFGLNGRNIARVLKETGINYVIIELNPNTVREEKKKGEKIIYGDVNKEEILKRAGIENANTVVFVISDPQSIRIGLYQTKKLNPSVYTIVRTRFISDTNELLNLGADEIIPEEFETSLQIFSKVLRKYHVPLNVIMKQVQIIRNESYSILRNAEKYPQHLSNLGEILAAGITETYFVNEENIHIGKTLADIDLRAKTDATVIAIVRENETISSPTSREKILANDTLVITGTHQSVDTAIKYLNQGEV
jgi:CPA2 family monovalent cation:H+ antiporter-2